MHVGSVKLTVTLRGDMNIKLLCVCWRYYIKLHNIFLIVLNGIFEINSLKNFHTFGVKD